MELGPLAKFVVFFSVAIGTPKRFACQAEPASVGVTRLLRPAGAAARLPPQPGDVGQGREGAGGRGQDAGDHDRLGPQAAGGGGYRPRCGPAGPGHPGDAGLYGLPGRDAVRAAVPRKRRQEPGNPGAARPGGIYTGLCRGGGHHGRGEGFAAVPGIQWPEPEAGGEAAGHRADLRAGQAAAERRRAAVAAVAAFVPGDGDHLPAGAGGADGGCAIPRRARGAANDDALRPPEEEGHAEHRRADSYLRAVAIRRLVLGMQS